MGKSRSKLLKKVPASASQSNTQSTLFQLDSAGDSSVRRSLLSSQSAAGGKLAKGAVKKLRSDEILSQLRQGGIQPSHSRAALAGLEDLPGAASSSRKKNYVDPATKARLKRMTGRDGKGQGLHGLKTAAGEEKVSAAVKDAGSYDPWAARVAVQEADPGMSKVVRNSKAPEKPKAPKTLHTPSFHVPLAAIPAPHPGQSYNPTQEAHQELLQSTLDRYEAEEAREVRSTAVAAQMDAARESRKGKEDWELAELEVGDGEVMDADVEEEALPPKKRPARKTQAQRNRAARVALEMAEIKQKKERRRKDHEASLAPLLLKTLTDSKEKSLAAKVAKANALRSRLASSGLSRLRSGPSKVPEESATFQLGDELAENLRTLQPEGNLWKEWVGSKMRRGELGMVRADEKKGKGGKWGRGKDKGSRSKQVEKFAWKRFE